MSGFELVNEPNYQLWPQRVPSTSGDPFALSALQIGGTVAQLLKTAQTVSARVGHTTTLYAPSSSDTDSGSRIVTRYDDFTTALLDAFPAAGYTPHSKQAWSHHNYLDVEGRVTTRIQAVRTRLAGRWAPEIFVTEGGARIAKMRTLYPGEDPLAAQAKCLQTAWELHNAASGVGMLAQYLLYGDPNFDCGLLEPAPSVGQAAVVRDLEDVPQARVRRAPEEIAVLGAREGAARPARVLSGAGADRAGAGDQRAVAVPAAVVPALPRLHAVAGADPARSGRCARSPTT